MIGSTALCIASYLLIALSPDTAAGAVAGLAGVGICGFSVGIMWPGTFSLASASIRGGGTAMFALLALAGDVGCMSGPTLAGFVSGAFGDNLRVGILAGILFPLLMICGLFFLYKGRKTAS
jgi:MFS family permease